MADRDGLAAAPRLCDKAFHDCDEAGCEDYPCRWAHGHAGDHQNGQLTWRERPVYDGHHLRRVEQVIVRKGLRPQAANPARRVAEEIHRQVMPAAASEARHAPRVPSKDPPA